MNPQVSSIIVNYNAGKALQDAVVTILRSDCVDKVFVVDNASSDQSMDFIQHLVESDSHLACIYNQRNFGFAKACNMAVREAKSRYLLFLNPDCILNPGALEIMLKQITRRKDVAVVGPFLFNTDGSEQAGGRRMVPTPWRTFVRTLGLSCLRHRYPKLFNCFLLNQQPSPDKPVELEAISGSCMLVRSAAIGDVGLLDEGYFLHCEDLDWFMRFRQKGWRILFVPSARVMHHKGLCSKDRAFFVEWHKHKGMMRFYRKFFRHQYPLALMWLVITGIWLRFGITILNRSYFLFRNRINHRHR